MEKQDLAKLNVSKMEEAEASGLCCLKTQMMLKKFWKNRIKPNSPYMKNNLKFSLIKLKKKEMMVAE